MIFSLNVYSSPISLQSSDTAYRFAQHVVQQQHQLYRVFFYHDGVYHGNQLMVATDPSQNAQVIADKWHELAGRHEIDLVLCVKSALKRGVIDEMQSRQHVKQGHNLNAGFELSGLGQMIDAVSRSDRIITFA